MSSKAAQSGRPYTNNLVQPGQGDYVLGRERTQPIPVHSIGKRSWREAYTLYKANPHESAAMKLITKSLAIYLPINMVDDVIPFIGQLDDPLIPATAALTAFTLWRVSRYRRP